MTKKTRLDFLKQGLVGLAALVSSYLPLQAESVKPIRRMNGDIVAEQETETPKKKVENFGIYDAGLYVPREKEPYRALEREMFDKNRKVKGDLEKVLGETLDFKITPKVREIFKEVTGKVYPCFDRCTESELLDAWEIDGKRYLLGRYDFWRYDENGRQVADQNLVVVSEKGIFPLLPAKIPTGGIVYTAVAGDDGKIIVAELGKEEKILGNMVVVYTPNKDGEYSAKPDGYIKLPESPIYTPVDAVKAFDEKGQSYDGVRYKHISGECRILGTSQNQDGKFPIYRFSNPEKSGGGDDK